MKILLNLIIKNKKFLNQYKIVNYYKVMFTIIKLQLMIKNLLGNIL